MLLSQPGVQCSLLLQRSLTNFTPLYSTNHFIYTNDPKYRQFLMSMKPLQIHSGLVTHPQLMMLQIKTVSFTKTFITSLQHISLNVLSNNSRSYKHVTEICSSYPLFLLILQASMSVYGKQ